MIEYRLETNCKIPGDSRNNKRSFYKNTKGRDGTSDKMTTVNKKPLKKSEVLLLYANCLQLVYS
jgi:hypothetical protein